MKPHIKFQDGMWMCGGLFVEPWYIDWMVGDSPWDAYQNWVRLSGLLRNKSNCL